MVKGVAMCVWVKNHCTRNGPGETTGLRTADGYNQNTVSAAAKSQGQFLNISA